MVAGLAGMSMEDAHQVGIILPQHCSDGESQVNAGAVNPRSLVDVLPGLEERREAPSDEIQELRKAVQSLTAALR